MTAKALSEAIQDTKISASVVVSDRGRLQPVTRIVAAPGVVMLICRPRPRWEAAQEAQGEPKAEQQFTLKRIDDPKTIADHAYQRYKAEEERLAELKAIADHAYQMYLDSRAGPTPEKPQ